MDATNASPAPLAAADDHQRASPGAWLMLAVLAFITAFDYLDRYLLYYLAEPIKRDLQLSDGELGLIGGLAFAIFHTIFVLPVARLADLWSRRWVIALGVATWSSLTAASAAVQSFTGLFAVRAGVAIGTSSAGAPAHSLVADHFPVRQRATARAALSVGAVIGIVAASALGGYLGDLIGWRATFLVFGLSGLTLAMAAALFLRDRRDRTVPTVKHTSMLAVVADMARNPVLRWLVAGASIHMFVSSAMSAWMPSFLIRNYHVSTSTAGAIIGTGAAIAGITGTFLGGWVTDRIGTRDPRWYLWLPAFGFAAATPLYLLALHAHTPTEFLAFYIPAVFGSVLFLGPTYAIIQNLARIEDRATTSAVALLCINLIGGALGAPATGYFSDWMGGEGGGASIRTALALSLAMNVPAIVAYIVAARRLPLVRFYARRAEEAQP
jgi:predicted MFS family arabinose efflux permease